MDFSQQIKDAIAGWSPDKVKEWNNTSWAHTLLLAAGWGPFGEAPGTAGAWLPSVEDRKNAVMLLKLGAPVGLRLGDRRRQEAASRHGRPGSRDRRTSQ